MFRPILPFLALGLLACEPQPVTPGAFPGSGDAVATVNGVALNSGMIDTVLRSLPEQVRAQLEAAGDNTPLVESIVAGELLYQEALKSNLHNDALVQQDMSMAVRSALAEAQVRKVVAERLSDDKISAWYDEHKVQFARPQLQLAHIMFDDMAAAEAVKAQLDAGGDFAALAKDNSLDTMTAAKGGEIGWLDMQQVAPPLRDHVQDAAKGDVVGPLDMGRTKHVFKVLDRRDVKPLDEVRDQIAAEVETEIRDAYLDELRSSAVVVETYKQAAPAAVPAPGAAPAPEAASGPDTPPAELENGAEAG